MDRKYVGVLINVFGSIAINLGNNLQSSGHRSHKHAHGEETDDLERLNSKFEQQYMRKHKKDANSDRKYNFSHQSSDSDSLDHKGAFAVNKKDFLWALIDCSGGQPEESSLHRKLSHKTHHRIQSVTSMKDTTPGPYHVPSWLMCNQWLLGTCFFLCGTVAVFVSYSFAPQSLIAPLGSVQFVSNIFFAKLIHESPITRRMLIATAVILAGISLVVHFSPDPNPDLAVLNSSNIRDLYFYYNYQVTWHPLFSLFLVYMYALACIALSSHVLYVFYGRSLLLNHKSLPFDKSLRPICFALLSAIIGTQSTLQAKCLSELLIRVDASAAFTEWFTYISFAAFLLTTAFWLYRLNRALALFEPLFIIPVLQVFWTCFATMNGGIFFREFFGEVFLTQKISGFISGMAIIFFGVYLLAPSNHDVKEDRAFSGAYEMRKMPSTSSSASSRSSSGTSMLYEPVSQQEAVPETKPSYLNEFYALVNEVDENLKKFGDRTTPQLELERRSSKEHAHETQVMQVLADLESSTSSQVAVENIKKEYVQHGRSQQQTNTLNIRQIHSSEIPPLPSVADRLIGMDMAEELDVESGAFQQKRSRSVSEILEEAQSILFGDEEQAIDPLTSFAPTLNGLMAEDSSDDD